MGRTADRSEFESRCGQEFSLLLVVQAASEHFSDFHPVDRGGGGYSIEVDLPGREAYHSSAASDRTKKIRSVHPLHLPSVL
jgi:hypothetical protein